VQAGAKVSAPPDIHVKWAHPSSMKIMAGSAALGGVRGRGCGRSPGRLHRGQFAVNRATAIGGLLF
jgi:hypothetical protein